MGKIIGKYLAECIVKEERSREDKEEIIEDAESNLLLHLIF